MRTADHHNVDPCVYLLIVTHTLEGDWERERQRENVDGKKEKRKNGDKHWVELKKKWTETKGSEKVKTVNALDLCSCKEEGMRGREGAGL